MKLLSPDFECRVRELVKDYGYLDDVQDNILTLTVQAAAQKLYGAGVPVQEDNPEYAEALMNLAAYRYLKRSPLATSAGANEKDAGYEAMVHDYIYRLRYPEVRPDAP